MKIIARIILTEAQVEQLRPVFDELKRLGYGASTLAQLYSSGFYAHEIVVGVLESERSQQVQAIAAPEWAGQTVALVIPPI